MVNIESIDWRSSCENLTGSYTDDERESYKEIIFSNTIQSMHVILDAMQLLQIELGNQSLVPVGKMIQSLPSQVDKDYLDPHLVTAIRQLWQDPGVKRCFERSREFQLSRFSFLLFQNLLGCHFLRIVANISVWPQVKWLSSLLFRFDWPNRTA